jgi:hypothetical protein
MAANQSQNDWIRTVLGVQPGTAEGGGSPEGGLTQRWPGIKSIWTRASDQVDAQLTALQTALRDSGDQDYREIAEMGLNGVTGNHKVRLMAGLMQIDAAAGPPEPAAARKVRQTIAAFIEHLASDPRIDAVDTNELGVTVKVADTLIPALEELDGALEQWSRP